ncbi:XrtA/PEP-CTERM system TPR-repeat protein PrsT [Thalassotalea euphylliae]|uniref:PEP-CTERM system TPR-repeat protein PrsT n=1 Tax=Thalassotalea euphylliae TaxID=1655234 RepID=A0A3E0U024_9GAMM|nr:XrtA/PEP-CTERM system TPR-repeat protein PrsT [Thalassotalea euphylliae]REL30030.1 PEP-CTERM system TPR-repeat protein PrsT [Thalassotalea euphylliae]
MLRSFALLPLLASFSILASNDLEKAISAYQVDDIEAAYIHLKNTLNSDAENLPAKVLMGRVLLRKGLYSEGIQEFNDALAAGADANQFIFEQVRAMLLLGKNQELIDLLDNLILNKKNQIATLQIKSNAFIALEKYDQALGALKQAENLNSKDIGVISSLANFFIAERSFEQAWQYITLLTRLVPDNNKTWKLRADYFTAKGNAREALENLERAHQLAPEDPIVMRALAHKYTDAKQHEKALMLVETIIELTPNDPYARLLKSQLLTRTNQLDEAQQVLEDISAKLSLLTEAQKSSNASLAYISGAAALMQGNLELAQNELAFYTSYQPNDVAGLNMLSAIYLQLGKVDKAQELLERNEKVVLKDLGLSLKLFKVYLSTNKIYKAKSVLESLSSTFKDNSQILIAQANYLAKSKRYEEAMTLLKSRQPNAPSASYTLTKGLISLEMGNFKQALEVADSLLAISSENIDFINFKAVTLLKVGRPDQAVSLFTQVLDSTPEHYATKFNLASALAATNEHSEALRVVNSLTEQGHGGSALLLLKAKLARDTNQPQLAITTAQKLLTTSPNNVDTIAFLVEVYYRTGQFKEALTHVERLNDLVFLEPNHLASKAKILIQLQDYQAAQQTLKVLLGLAESANDFYQLSLLQSQAQDLEAAYHSIEQAIEKSPAEPVLHLTQAKLAIEMKPVVESQRLLDKLSQNYPEDANVYLLQGDLLFKQGKQKQAYAAYRQALSLDNQFEQAAAQLYVLASQGVNSRQFSQQMEKILTNKRGTMLMRNFLADFYLNHQQLDKAKHHYKLLAEASHGNKAVFYNNLANIYLDEDIDTAKAYADKALSLMPNSTAIMDTYAWVLAKQGSYTEALTKLRNANALNSEDPVISYHIGYTLHKLNRDGEAKLELKKAVSSTLDFKGKSDAQDLLRFLEVGEQGN